MITSHCIKRIQDRKINIDLEILEYLCGKSQDTDTAFILGETEFLGDMNFIILIVRNGRAITIEFRRKGQTISEKSLRVRKLENYPCTF